MNWKKADAYNEGRLNGLHDELAAVFGEAQLVAEVQRKLRLKADGMFGPRTKAAVMAAVTAKAPRIGTTDIIDRRRFATPTYNGRPYKPKQRDIKDVTAICLHQMAGDYGERIARYNTLGAHLGVTVGAQQIWLYDFDLEVIHGNGWNARPSIAT